MSKMLKTLLLLLGAALIFAIGLRLGELRSRRAAPPSQVLASSPSPAAVQAATTPEAQTEHEARAAKRRLNVASMAALFDVEEAVADALLQEYESVREQYRLMTRDDVSDNDPHDVAAFYIRRLGAGAEANPILKEWLAGRPGTYIGESVWGESAELPRLKGPLPDFLLAGKYGNSGTGFFISPDGWLVTNAHVVGQHERVDIRGPGGLIVSTQVVKVDAKSDLALLKSDTPPRDYLQIHSQELPLGTRVFTIGFPNVDTQGAQAKFTEGSISSLAGYRDDPTDYQISVPLQQGNSGGALVDANTGRIVGVVTSSLSPSRADSVGYAIKAKALANLLRSTPACAGIALPADVASDSSREANIDRAHKASVMILVK